MTEKKLLEANRIHFNIKENEALIEYLSKDINLESKKHRWLICDILRKVSNRFKNDYLRIFFSRKFEKISVEIDDKIILLITVKYLKDISEALEKRNKYLREELEKL